MEAAVQERVLVRPLSDRVVIRPAKAEATTESGLVIPDTVNEAPGRGEVLAVGPGKRTEAGDLVPMDVAEGDTVVFSRYAGTEVRVNGEDVLVVSAADVLAVLGGEARA